MTADATRIATRAIGWATAHLDSPAYASRCLAFVEDAIERANGVEVFGGDDAAESAHLYDAAARTNEPPRGALVFYESVGEMFGERREWGHVGISLGDGQIIHAWSTVRIDPYLALDRLEPARGWEAPRFLGWVPLDRVLEGSRPREWGDDDAAATAARMQADRFSPPDGE